MKMFKQTLIGALSCLSMNTMASTPNSFDYFGISFQQNSYDNLNFSPSINTSELAPLIYNDSSSAQGTRVFLGHQFNRYIAVEAGISSLGKGAFSLTQKETDADGNIEETNIQKGNFKTLAGDLRFVGTYPLSDHIFLKAFIGAYIWDNELTVLAQSNDILITEKTSESDISLLTGLGIGYGFNDAVAISIDFENTEIAQITTQNIGVSLFIRF